MLNEKGTGERSNRRSLNSAEETHKTPRRIIEKIFSKKTVEIFKNLAPIYVTD